MFCPEKPLEVVFLLSELPFPNYNGPNMAPGNFLDFFPIFEDTLFLPF